MKRHDTHNVSSSEDGHSYIFSSQTPSEYSKTTNENKIIINKNKENLDLNKNEKNEKIKDKEIIKNKNESKEKGINNQENEKNINNINNKEPNNGREKIKKSEKENKDKKNEKSKENNSDKKSSNSCGMNEQDDEEMNHIKALSLKKMRSFEDNNHPELENQKSTKNIVNSQPNFRGKK